MNTKYIAYLILSFAVIISTVSCNDDNTTTYVDSVQSKNALITSFSLAGTPKDALDSITYPVLESTKFIIDQRQKLIYNPDSLAYGTRLAKFKATISLGETASTIDIDYGDTIFTWNSSEGDSIDFSKRLTFKVVPPAGNVYMKEYELKINIHQYDPDTLHWGRVASLPVAVNVPLKAIALADNMVVYAVAGNKINAYTSSLNNVSWNLAVTELPKDIRLSSIMAFGNNLFAVSADGSSYKASTSDPANWKPVTNGMNVHNILGVLPAATEAEDQLLVVVNDNGKYKFGKTKDLASITLVTEITGFAEALVPTDERFPSHDFSSTTNYDRTKLVENHLAISGGVDFSGKNTADIWMISLNKKNVLEISPLYYGASNKPFEVKEDFKTFIYDEKMYAATNDTLYTSRWGMKWIKAVEKQQFDPQIKTAKNQTIVIDRENYIWIIGSENQAGRVWKGRLNRLAPKN